MTGHLIQLSGVIVDHIYWVDDFPAAGTEAIVRRSELCAGGGLNAMVAARRAGLEVTYAGTLGTGPFADIAEAALRAEDIRILRPRLASDDQGCCTCLIDRSGERTFVASPGAERLVAVSDLVDIAPRPTDWCLLSGYALCDQHSYPALTDWLKANTGQMRLVFDPSPLVAQIPASARAAALRAATWISANRAEAANLTDIPDPAQSAQALSRDRIGGAVVRDGANGCFVSTAGEPAQHVPGYSVETIDTNGAGDCHIGAFIAALAERNDPIYAAQFANVAAALSTTAEGPSTAPKIKDVQIILADIP